MNAGQEMFAKFFMDMVQEDKKTEGQAVLEECFKLQDEGTFTPEVMAGIMPRMFALVRPECVEQLKQAGQHFKTQL